MCAPDPNALFSQIVSDQDQDHLNTNNFMKELQFAIGLTRAQTWIYQS